MNTDIKHTLPELRCREAWAAKDRDGSIFIYESNPNINVENDCWTAKGETMQLSGYFFDNCKIELDWKDSLFYWNLYDKTWKHIEL